jgi:hypothetical protein
MPSEAWEAEAMLHVKTMFKYQKAHAISAEILAKYPTERDRMVEELSHSKEPHVRHELLHDPSEDVPALLHGWDEAISKEPTTLQEFVQFIFAGTPPNLQSTGTLINFIMPPSHPFIMTGMSSPRRYRDMDPSSINFIKRTSMRCELPFCHHCGLLIFP